LEKFHLTLLIHAHQPAGNFESVIERVFQQSYSPFVEHLARHPSVRIGLHYSGPLMEWLEAHHPEFLERLGSLAGRGQIEIVGGGFYEPILISIPPEDQQEQIRRMSEYIQRRFGRAPAGAWLAERVWEPQLPSVLEAAKVEYTLLDDVHFVSAGIEPDDLFGYYLAEDCGAKVRVIPGLLSLRYLIPFRSVEEIIGFLRSASDRHPGGMAAMGDDCEKFGAWPGTHDHCYRDGWLERFFVALEQNQNWLVTTPPGEYLREHAPLGRADLPAASYPELMEWVLPTRARQQFHGLEQEFSSRPDVRRFLRGGIWRGFLSKYPEVNLLHKKMLCVSRRVAEARNAKLPRAARRKLQEVHTHLLRAQCNDAYWHGIFGGLYSPHLRTELLRELIRAETLLDSLRKRRFAAVVMTTEDFDADGANEICVQAKSFSAVIKPADGATLAALDFRPSAVALINSIERRPEAYHARLAEAARASAGGVASIHETVRVKEPDLERRLLYDRFPRHAFRLLLFPVEKTWPDYESLNLEESAAFAAGEYKVANSGRGNVSFALEAPLEWVRDAAPAARLTATKNFQFEESADGFIVTCGVTLGRAKDGPQHALHVRAGIEIVLNFLAPNERDRYFEYTQDGKMVRQRLAWAGEIAAGPLRIVDEWQNVAALLDSPPGSKLWVAPIETVSESEEGFERVYQGSQILAVSSLELPPGGQLSTRCSLRVSKAHHSPA